MTAVYLIPTHKGLIMSDDYGSGNIGWQSKKSAKKKPHKANSRTVARVQIGILLEGDNFVDFEMDHWPPKSKGGFVFFNDRGGIVSFAAPGSYHKLVGQAQREACAFDLQGKQIIELYGLTRDFGKGEGYGCYWLDKESWEDNKLRKLCAVKVRWRIERKSMKANK